MRKPAEGPNLSDIEIKVKSFEDNQQFNDAVYPHYSNVSRNREVYHLGTFYRVANDRKRFSDNKVLLADLFTHFELELREKDSREEEHPLIQLNPNTFMNTVMTMIMLGIFSIEFTRDDIFRGVAMQMYAKQRKVKG